MVKGATVPFAQTERQDGIIHLSARRIWLVLWNGPIDEMKNEVIDRIGIVPIEYCIELGVVY